MALSFAVSVSVNNLLALKAFRTYLANYQQHEMPRGKRAGAIIRWMERKLAHWLVMSAYRLSRQRFMVGFAKQMVDTAAVNTFADLMLNPEALKASVALNDVQPGMFAILYLVQNPQYLNDVKAGKDLFAIISQLELEFALVKKPREGIKHE